MTDLDVVIAKTNSIQNCLKRIHDTLRGDVNRIDDFDVLDIVTLNLQRAVQLSIDMASHVIAKEQMGVSKSLKDVFVILEKYGVIDHELSIKMQKMIGFRNIAVHDYQAIDPAILKSILKRHLKDIEDFYTAVIKQQKDK